MLKETEVLVNGLLTTCMISVRKAFWDREVQGGRNVLEDCTTERRRTNSHGETHECSRRRA